MQQLQQTFVCRSLASDGRNADDSIVVRQLLQTIRAERRAIREARTGLTRPLIAEQPGHGHLQLLVCTGGVALEQPLRRIIGKQLRQSMWIFLCGHLLPDNVEHWLNSIVLQIMLLKGGNSFPPFVGKGLPTYAGIIF